MARLAMVKCTYTYVFLVIYGSKYISNPAKKILVEPSNPTIGINVHIVGELFQ